MLEVTEKTVKAKSKCLYLIAKLHRYNGDFLTFKLFVYETELLK